MATVEEIREWMETVDNSDPMWKEAKSIVGAFNQVKWERDVAISQLHELGYELGEETGKDNLISIHKYRSKNGYTGVFKKDSNIKELTVYDIKGKEVFHTFSSTVKNMSDLKRQVEDFPEFLKTIKGVLK